MKWMHHQPLQFYFPLLLLLAHPGLVEGLEYMATERGMNLSWQKATSQAPFFEQVDQLKQSMAIDESFRIKRPDTLVQSQAIGSIETGLATTNEPGRRDRVVLAWRLHQPLKTTKYNAPIRPLRWEPNQRYFAKSDLEHAGDESHLNDHATSHSIEFVRVPDLLISVLLLTLAVLLFMWIREINLSRQKAQKSS